MCLSAGEWANNLWYVNTVEYYAGVKRSTVPTPPATWVNLHNVLLSARNPAQKATHCIIVLI